MAGGRQIQSARRLQRVDLPVQAEERSLPLQKIKHRIQNRLRRGAGEMNARSFTGADWWEIS